MSAQFISLRSGTLLFTSGRQKNFENEYVKKDRSGKKITMSHWGLILFLHSGGLLFFKIYFGKKADCVATRV
jgi:hypothetical protein